MRKSSRWIGLALGLLLAACHLPAKAEEVTIQGTVGHGTYSITVDRYDIVNPRHRKKFATRRLCERSLNYDKGAEARFARDGDVLVQCERVYVRSRCYVDWRPARKCYTVMWAPVRLHW